MRQFSGCTLLSEHSKAVLLGVNKMCPFFNKILESTDDQTSEEIKCSILKARHLCTDDHRSRGNQMCPF
jgi:hypothetical protein